MGPTDPRFLRRAMGQINPFQDGGEFEPEYQPMDEVPRPNAQPRPRFSRPMMNEGENDEEFMAARDKAVGPRLVKSAYEQAVLGGAPEREAFKPSKLRRLAAGVAGMGAGYENPGAGIQVAQGINETPWRNAYGDYTDKVNRLGKAENAESDEANNRTATFLAGRTFGLNRDKAAAEASYNRDRGRAAVTNADAAWLKANRADYDFKDVKGGVLAINKNDPGDTKVIPGTTTAQMQAEASQSNAATNRRRAGDYSRSVTGTIGHQQAQDRLGIMEHNRNANRDARTAQETEAVPTREQSNARDMALQEMADDPDWAADVLTPDDNGTDFYSHRPNADEDFQAELQDRIDEILSRRRPRR